MPPSSSPSAPMEDAAPHKRTVMADSGQTEEERRILRHKQRKLNEDLHRDGDLQRLHQRNNELFQAVNFTREAVLDADNHLALSAQYVKLADKMVQVSRGKTPDLGSLEMFLRNTKYMPCHTDMFLTLFSSVSTTIINKPLE